MKYLTEERFLDIKDTVNLYVSLSRYEAATTLLRSLTSEYGRQARLSLLEGMLYHRQGMYQQAIEKYDEVFMESLSVGKDELSGLSYQSIPAWDSVGHMDLVAELEDAFEITLETDDIIDFNSYEKGKEILKKYQIEC